MFSLKNYADSSILSKKEDSTGNCSAKKVEKSEFGVARYAAIYRAVALVSSVIINLLRLLFFSFFSFNHSLIFREHIFVCFNKFLLSYVDALSSIITTQMGSSQRSTAWYT